MSMADVEALTCFKAYDVRGKLGSQLSENIVYRIGLVSIFIKILKNYRTEQLNSCGLTTANELTWELVVLHLFRN